MGSGVSVENDTDYVWWVYVGANLTPLKWIGGISAGVGLVATGGLLAGPALGLMGAAGVGAGVCTGAIVASAAAAVSTTIANTAIKATTRQWGEDLEKDGYFRLNPGEKKTLEGYSLSLTLRASLIRFNTSFSEKTTDGKPTTEQILEMVTTNKAVWTGSTANYNRPYTISWLLENADPLEQVTSETFVHMGTMDYIDLALMPLEVVGAGAAAKSYQAGRVARAAAKAGLEAGVISRETAKYAVRNVVNGKKLVVDGAHMGQGFKTSFSVGSKTAKAMSKAKPIADGVKAGGAMLAQSEKDEEARRQRQAYARR